MMLAIWRGIAAVAVIAACSAPADAWWNDCDNCVQHRSGTLMDSLHKGGQRNARWPSPYLCADRAHVRSPFEAMIVNGWRRQNLLGGHHFNGAATELTQSGKLKVRWIMTQAPPEFRQVFVERSLEEGVTEARIAAAQDFATLVARGGDAPRVADTHIISEGRPAATVDFVNTQFRENMPTPTLPESTQGFESGQ
ncbi:MAG: hypothetical protein AAGG46_10455 [Planctomycetota bacterium]